MKKKYFQKLSVEEKHIIKDKGTEPPFSGEYNDFFAAGIFLCRACQSPLYESSSKFDSGCGWPSFDDEIEGAIIRYEDLSGGRVRVEICCANCDGHLGHVFHGEQITKKNTRHCVNSLSIQFKSYKNLKKAVFGSACFWSLQKTFNSINGIYLSSVGYMSKKTNLNKESDAFQTKKDAQKVVELYFDPKIVSYQKLLYVFMAHQDYIGVDKQSNELIIFYDSEEQKKTAEKLILKKDNGGISILLSPISNFYRAEEYHQNYFEKNIF